jgi:hypothetical protein
VNDDTAPTGVPALAAYLAKRERTAQLRRQLAEARAAGLKARHATKLRRAEARRNQDARRRQ